MYAPADSYRIPGAGGLAPAAASAAGAAHFRQLPVPAEWRPGAILVNGRPATVAAVLHTGDAVTADVSDLPGENPHIRPVDYPLDILWRMRTCWC